MKRHLAIAALALTILAVAAVGAFAALTVKTGRYEGALKGSETEKVSFKVIGGGTKVTAVKVTPYVPNRCGAGGTPPREVSKPAQIKRGAFSAKVVEELTNGAVTGEATVTGRFLSGGRVKGLVKVPLPEAPECAGSFPYTAKVSG